MNTIKIMMMGDWGFQKKTNTIKITIMMLGPHLMMITKRKIVLERGTRPTLECSNGKDHDENLLHTITRLNNKWLNQY
jgi:hypothetical protein